ncbi:Lipid phosphate phosphatase gamma [Diplonema papillatum]|nr:Lipid phosphate phosphatase gamma [Diplonema papillatum]
MQRTLFLAGASVLCIVGALGAISASKIDGEVLSMCKGIGIQPFIDVTVPHGATYSEVLAVLYSFVPWIVSLITVSSAFRRRTITLLAAAMYIVLVVICNEILVKRNFPQSRPSASCLLSPGMPSSHSLLSIGLLVWLFLEMAENRGIKGWWGFVAILILAPVPPSRVVLQDHSLEQVTAGSLLGMASAIAFFSVLRRSAKSSLIDRLCSHPVAIRFGVVNDYLIH